MCSHNNSKGRCAKTCPGFVARTYGPRKASDGTEKPKVEKVEKPADAVKATADLAIRRAEPENVLGICKMPLYPEFCDFDFMFHKIQKGPWIEN